jgi:hypothetical protein
MTAMVNKQAPTNGRLGRGLVLLVRVGSDSRFARGLETLKSFGNLDLLIPGLENLEICENLVKVMDFEAIGHGDFIFHNKQNKKSVYLAFILFFSARLISPKTPPAAIAIYTMYTVVHSMHVPAGQAVRVLNKPCVQAAFL